MIWKRLLVLFVKEADVIKQRVGVTDALSLLFAEEISKNVESVWVCSCCWGEFTVAMRRIYSFTDLEQRCAQTQLGRLDHRKDRQKVQEKSKRQRKIVSSVVTAALLIDDWNVKTQHRREMTHLCPKACSQASKKDEDESLQGFNGHRPPKHSRSSAWTASELISPTLCETSAPPPGTASSTYSPGKQLCS